MLKKLLIILLTLGLTVFVFVFSFVLYVRQGGYGKIPTRDELSQIKHDQASVVYSSDNQILGKFFEKNRTNIKYKDLPKNLIESLIATEDARFYEHKGIDRIALLRVICKTIILRQSNSGGGSTISQQLAKNLYPRQRYEFLSLPANKIKECILANRLNDVYTKEEILALYFNTVPFGENVYGIESAAQRFFSVPVEKLTVNESAVLVGLLKANTYYNPRKNPENAIQRRNTVFNKLLKYNYIDTVTHDSLTQTPITLKYRNLDYQNPNGYFLHIVENEAENILKNHLKNDHDTWNIKRDGLIIETTLISELQRSALEARRNHLTKLQKHMNEYWDTQLKNEPQVQRVVAIESQNTPKYRSLKRKKYKTQRILHSLKIVKTRNIFTWEDQNQDISTLDSISHYLKMVNAAVYAINSNTGAVNVYVGGNNYDYMPYDLTKSKRQAASTFKPIIYAAAIEKGLKPCDWISNNKVTYAKYQNWSPSNYDHKSGGHYSMGGALAKSVNIPTIKTYFKVGATNIQNTANALGLTQKIKRVPSSALGTTTYSLQDLVHAYATFSNKTKYQTPHFIKSIKTHKGETIYTHKTDFADTIPLLAKQTLEKMQYMLKGVVERGTGARLKWMYNAKGDWAGKTGTSQSYSDSWFVAFNKNLVIGTWVGCKYPTIGMPSKVSGGSRAALPIIGNILSKEYSTPELNKNLSAGFDDFSEETIADCDCDFYREPNILDMFDTDFNTENSKYKDIQRLASSFDNNSIQRDSILQNKLSINE
ncbi:transglycosylase domain-containing protein [Wenyingzhuangia sp. IMCC45533]